VSEIPPSSAPHTGSPAPDSGGPTAKRTWVTVVIVALSVVVLGLIIAIIWMVASNAAAPAPTTSPTPTATTASPTPTPVTTPTSTSAVARCTVDHLTLSLGTPNGAAGSEIIPIIFTNTGSTSCELHGFPGVSFVGDGNGTQLGAAADEDSTVAIQQNTVKPGTAVQAQVKVVQAANFSNCTVVAADGFRVYPPHSFEAVFVKATGLSACSNADVHLLAVQPVLPQ
jgi:hypothetical protein